MQLSYILINVFAIVLNIACSIWCIYYLVILYRASHSRQRIYRLWTFGLTLVAQLLVQAETIIQFGKQCIDFQCNVDVWTAGTFFSWSHNVVMFASLLVYAYCLLERYERLEMTSRMAKWMRRCLTVLFLVLIVFEMTWKIGLTVHKRSDYPRSEPSDPWPYESVFGTPTTLLTLAFVLLLLVTEFLVNMRLIYTSLHTLSNTESTHRAVFYISKLKLKIKHQMIILFTLVILMDCMVIGALILGLFLNLPHTSTMPNFAQSWSSIHFAVCFKLLDVFLVHLQHIQHKAKELKHMGSAALASSYADVLNGGDPVERKKIVEAVADSYSNTMHKSAAPGRTFLSTHESS